MTIHELNSFPNSDEGVYDVMSSYHLSPMYKGGFCKVTDRCKYVQVECRYDKK